MLKIDTGSIEWIAAPVLLAYFSAKGWKTEDPWWFRKLPLWRPVLRIAATTLLVVLPVLLALPLYAVVVSYARGLSADRRGREMRVSVAAEQPGLIVHTVAVYRQEATLLGPRFQFQHLERVPYRPADTTGRIGTP